MNEITQKQLKGVLNYDQDTGKFTWLKTMNGFVKAGSLAGTTDSHGYTQIQVCKRLYLAHRLAWLYIYGKMPVLMIDHINGDRKDNRLANLREATNGQNRANSAPKHTHKGVRWCETKRKWIAQITANKKSIHLGTFANESDAEKAYSAAAKHHFGEFMRVA